MKAKIFRCLSVILLVGIFLSPGSATAQDAAADAFRQYTNPHDICDYYRTSAGGFTVVRESDNECLVSVGEGQYTVYTQYFYSGDQWCFELSQEGVVQYGDCVAIPHSNPVGDFFSNLDIDSEDAPYIIAGSVLIVGAIVAIAASGAARTRALKAGTQAGTSTGETPVEEVQGKTFNPKAKRSGRGSYGWEEMETSTTEEINAKPPKGPEGGQSLGGIGLHQGEPLVNNTASELEKLAELRKNKLISAKEYRLAKKKLLKL